MMPICLVVFVKGSSWRFSPLILSKLLVFEVCQYGAFCYRSSLRVSPKKLEDIGGCKCAVWYSKHVNCRGFGKNYKPLGEGMAKV